LKTLVENCIFPSQHREFKCPLIFFVESSNQLKNLRLQHNGFELTCGAVSMRARFAHDIELPLIYKMHF
jgi:hypothetical protein